MSYAWGKIAWDYLDSPRFGRLLKANPCHLEWWLRIVRIASKADDDGRLAYDGRWAWEVVDLAYKLRISEAECDNFIQLCLGLELLTKDDNFFCLTNPEDWYGSSALTGAERAQRYRERRKMELLETNKEDEKAERNEEVTACNEGITKHNALDKTKTKTKTRLEAEQAARAREPGPAMLASFLQDFQDFQEVALPAVVPTIDPSYQETDFWEACAKLHSRLTGAAKFNSMSRQRVRELLKDEPWSSESWHHRAAALELASQRAQYRLEQGEEIRAKWPWLLRWADDHLGNAIKQIETAKFAVSNGYSPAPLRWLP